jgi:hypothetical protein
VSEIEDVEVKGSDVFDAKLFYYRTAGGVRRFARLETKDGRLFIIDRKYLPQLFRYLDISQNDLITLDYAERDEMFLEALKRCKTKLVYSVIPESNRVVRIVSSDFTAIPHSKVIQLVEQVLKGGYEDRKVEFDGGMFAKWTLNSWPVECARLLDIVSWELWVYNRNDGKHGLRIGGGFTVLKCRNGAIGWKSAAKVRIVHRGDYEDLLSRIQEAIDDIVNRALPSIAYQIQEAQRVKAAKEHIEKLINLYPQWIQRRLREQLKKAHTLWDVSNAFSWVATHEPVTFNQRIQLSSHAVEVLKLVERR